MACALSAHLDCAAWVESLVQQGCGIPQDSLLPSGTGMSLVVLEQQRRKLTMCTCSHHERPLRPPAPAAAAGWVNANISFMRSNGYSISQRIPHVTVPSLVIWGRCVAAG